MPTVAAYIVLQDAPGTIGDPISDTHLEFEVPQDFDLDTSAPSILMFRVAPLDDDVTLVVRLNNTGILGQHFNAGPERSWHEVFPTTAFRISNQELVMSSATSDHPTRIQVSDVVLIVPVMVPPPRKRLGDIGGGAVQIFIGGT
jgi:hypothetical protein